MVFRPICMLILASALFSCERLTAQDTSSHPSSDKAFTVNTSTRLVVEDVLVTDAQGQPVDNLPRTAFHVQDEGKDQQILSFDQASKAKQSKLAVVDPAGEFSNIGLTSAGGNIVVLLIDPVGMEIADQMYLRLQMLSTLRAIAPDTRVAVFRTNGGERPLLVQSLTKDHALLTKAINNSVPKQTRPVSSAFANALSEIANIAQYFAQAPGPKRLLWFAGSFPLYNSPGGIDAIRDVSDQKADLRVAYELLERARIQVFPIDVRGVMAANIALSQPSTVPFLAGGPSSKGATVQGDAIQQTGQWGAMDAIAADTGGKAFYSNNSISTMVENAIDLGNHSYTLSFRPSDTATTSDTPQTARWHAVTLRVDGPYALSYRRGYFDAESPSGVKLAENLAESRPEDLPSARKGKRPEDAENAVTDLPIVFRAKLASASGTAKRGSVVLTVNYGILARDLLFNKTGDGHEQAQVKVAAMAYDGDGEVLSSAVDTFKTNYDSTQVELARKIGVPMSQTIEVAKRAKYLLLAVVDQSTGRTGTVQLTMDTAKSLSH